MNHRTIEQVMDRANRAKSDSDFTHFFNLLLAMEALAKTIVLGFISAISDDKDRNRYRLEHKLVRLDGIGGWKEVLEDALGGPASQFLIPDARVEQSELNGNCKSGSWQYDATYALNEAAIQLGFHGEKLADSIKLIRWFDLMAMIRNKTRAHGAPKIDRASNAIIHIASSVELVYNNFHLFKRQWAYLNQNLSGKYRVSEITDKVSDFECIKRNPDTKFSNGIYVFFGAPRKVSLMRTDAECQDFFFANGGFNDNTYEMLSYYSDDRENGDSSSYREPPGILPRSETEGLGELIVRGNCFTNVPEMWTGYIERPTLEADLKKLLLDDKRPIVTLVGRGGIGKTSLALKVIHEVFSESRYQAIVWLSARDIDLQLTGPKPVRPQVLTPDDMGKYYAGLVLPVDQTKSKGFKARTYFENQLQNNDTGPCLYVFDNFETTQNPIEIYNWIDTFIRLPNKALITTRLRDFKGDYPLEVQGMKDDEARQLVSQTAKTLGVSDYLYEKYIIDLIAHSEGHPYVIKILLGEVAKAKRAADIKKIVAGSEDILTALFERTYAALSPCAQRAFLTLSAWNSPVPRLALEAVLFKSTEERNEVEKGIESLLHYSMAEIHVAPLDKQEFVGLPLVASAFGKKKLNISPTKSAVQDDVEILKMFGTSNRSDAHLGLEKRLKRFIENISPQIDRYEEKFKPVLEAICRVYNPGWFLLARWYMEGDDFKQAKDAIKRYLENGPPEKEAAEAWRLLAHVCYRTNDALGEVHAFIERSQISQVPFYDLSNTANKLNQFLREHGFEIDKDQKRDLAGRIASVLFSRRDEAQPDDLSRMAWLAIHLGQETSAIEYVEEGLKIDPSNYHIIKLAQRFNIL